MNNFVNIFFTSYTFYSVPGGFVCVCCDFSTKGIIVKYFSNCDNIR